MSLFIFTIWVLLCYTFYDQIYIMKDVVMLIKPENPMNPMGVVPIPKLLWDNSIPLIFSLLAHSLYNFVDSVFVSYVSEAALTALSMAAPVQSLIGALGCGIAVGLNAAISKAMGEKDEQKVRDTASASLWLAVAAWLIVALVCIVGVEPYFAWQSAGNREIAEAGVSYLRICILFSLGTFGQWVYDRFVMATGKSSLFLITLSVASVVNLILDPIFIFGWLGLPPMGTTGAAIATVIGQFCGAVTGIILNEKKNPEIYARFLLRVPLGRIADILKVGIPTSIMQSTVAFTGIALNTMLQGFSSTAVAIMGICNRIQGLATLPPHGINNALIPIVAYNYGAKIRERILKSIRWAYIYSFAMMGVVLLGLELFPGRILMLFDASAHMLSIGTPAIRIMAVAFFLSVIGMIGSTVFQAMGKGNYSMYLTLARQVVMPLGFVYLISLSGNLSLVWYAFILAEILSAPLTVYLLGRIRRDILSF